MRLSDLLEAEVRTEEGEKLGRVHDVRVRHLERRTPDGYALRLVGLVIGGRGIRERLGIDVARTAAPIAARELVEWERVLDVDGERGVVTVRE
jgi:sporulation protein YlmC with PRC-barrel domain